MRLESLVNRGLIEKEKVRDSPMFTVYRYYVPLNVHYAWCQWCAERPDGEDMVQSTDANAASAQ